MDWNVVFFKISAALSRLWDAWVDGAELSGAVLPLRRVVMVCPHKAPGPCPVHSCRQTWIFWHHPRDAFLIFNHKDICLLVVVVGTHPQMVQRIILHSFLFCHFLPNTKDWDSIKFLFLSTAASMQKHFVSHLQSSCSLGSEVWGLSFLVWWSQLHIVHYCAWLGARLPQKATAQAAHLKEALGVNLPH